MWGVVVKLLAPNVLLIRCPLDGRLYRDQERYKKVVETKPCICRIFNLCLPARHRHIRVWGFTAQSEWRQTEIMISVEVEPTTSRIASDKALPTHLSRLKGKHFLPQFKYPTPDVCFEWRREACLDQLHALSIESNWTQGRDILLQQGATLNGSW
jgi:hypothetical protein